MTTEIQKAIARSIATTSIVTVEVANLNDALSTIRECGHEYGHATVDGAEDVWSADGEWRLRVTADYGAIAWQSIACWERETLEHRRLDAGFIAFCWDMRQETLAALTDCDDAQIIPDLVYSANQGEWGGFRLDDEKLTEAFASLLDIHRRELVEALRESLEG